MKTLATVTLTSEQCREITRLLESLRVEVTARVAVMAAAIGIATRKPRSIDSDCREKLMELPIEIAAHHAQVTRQIHSLLGCASETFPGAGNTKRKKRRRALLR